MRRTSCNVHATREAEAEAALKCDLRRRVMVSSRVFATRSGIARMPNWFARAHTHDTTRDGSNTQQHAAIVAARPTWNKKFCHVCVFSWSFKRIICYKVSIELTFYTFQALNAKRFENETERVRWFTTATGAGVTEASQTRHMMSEMMHDKSHTPHTTRHTSHVTRHTSHVTRHALHLQMI